MTQAPRAGGATLAGGHPPSPLYRVVVVGAGLVGLATAYGLQRSAPGISLAVVDKEEDVARHQSGHNSGVLHSGIYYRPGSLKAQLCVAGARLMVAFCEEHGIAHARVGKLVVAARPQEEPQLLELHRRGEANGVEGLRLLSPEEMREVEPHAGGVRGLFVGATGIVDYPAVARRLAALLATGGADLLLGAEVCRVERRGGEIQLSTTAGDLRAQFVVNAAGLYADRVAQLFGERPPVQIVPFRGEYHLLRPERRHLVRALIYPVPDPRFPFLGVHFTRTVGGDVEVGPNAVLAFSREGYRKDAIHPGELWETLRYAGFWALARKYWRTGLSEFYRSYSTTAFARSAQELVPELRRSDLVPGGAGVRAQAVRPDGVLVDDFVLQDGPQALHVLNAPSPAATASLAIGATIARRVLERLGEITQTVREGPL